jgi:hypothetical protein
MIRIIRIKPHRRRVPLLLIGGVVALAAATTVPASAQSGSKTFSVDVEPPTIYSVSLSSTSAQYDCNTGAAGYQKMRFPDLEIQPFAVGSSCTLGANGYDARPVTVQNTGLASHIDVSSTEPTDAQGHSWAWCSGYLTDTDACTFESQGVIYPNIDQTSGLLSPLGNGPCGYYIPLRVEATPLCHEPSADLAVGASFNFGLRLYGPRQSTFKTTRSHTITFVAHA